MADIFQTFLLIATLDIALIAVTIANYAVSASYLGRETRLTRWRLEKRKDQLDKKVKELQAKGSLQLRDLKKEIKEAEDEQERLGVRIVLLSWIGAVVIPCILFIISLVIAVLGMNSDILVGSEFANVLNTQFIVFSSGILAIGFAMLLIVIRTIDSAARQIPLPEFEISFMDFEKIAKAKRNEQTEVTVCLRNKGEDIAENIKFIALFSPEFKLHAKTPYYVVHQSATSDRPDYNAAVFDFDSQHVDIRLILDMLVTVPDKRGTYEIPVEIYESKTGKSTHRLFIEVTD